MFFSRRMLFVLFFCLNSVVAGVWAAAKRASKKPTATFYNVVTGDSYNDVEKSIVEMIKKEFKDDFQFVDRKKGGGSVLFFILDGPINFFSEYLKKVDPKLSSLSSAAKEAHFLVFVLKSDDQYKKEISKKYDLTASHYYFGAPLGGKDEAFFVFLDDQSSWKSLNSQNRVTFKKLRKFISLNSI